jgi:hypothetical protein
MPPRPTRKVFVGYFGAHDGAGFLDVAAFEAAGGHAKPAGPKWKLETEDQELVGPDLLGDAGMSASDLHREYEQRGDEMLRATGRTLTEFMHAPSYAAGLAHGIARRLAGKRPTLIILAEHNVTVAEFMARVNARGGTSRHRSIRCWMRSSAEAGVKRLRARGLRRNRPSSTSSRRASTPPISPRRSRRWRRAWRAW